MIRKLTVFETADGKRFNDPMKAREYAADMCREAIDSRLAELQAAGRISASDRYRVVMAILPNADAAATLSATLARWVDYAREDGEG